MQSIKLKFGIKDNQTKLHSSTPFIKVTMRVAGMGGLDGHFINSIKHQTNFWATSSLT